MLKPRRMRTAGEAMRNALPRKLLKLQIKLICAQHLPKFGARRVEKEPWQVLDYERTHQPWAPCDPHAHHPWAPCDPHAHQPWASCGPHAHQPWAPCDCCQVAGCPLTRPHDLSDSAVTSPFLVVEAAGGAYAAAGDDLDECPNSAAWTSKTVGLLCMPVHVHACGRHAGMHIGGWHALACMEIGLPAGMCIHTCIRACMRTGRAEWSLPLVDADGGGGRLGPGDGCDSLLSVGPAAEYIERAALYLPCLPACMCAPDGLSERVDAGPRRVQDCLLQDAMARSHVAHARAPRVQKKRGLCRWRQGGSGGGQGVQEPCRNGASACDRSARADARRRQSAACRPAVLRGRRYRVQGAGRRRRPVRSVRFVTRRSTAPEPGAILLSGGLAVSVHPRDGRGMMHMSVDVGLGMRRARVRLLYIYDALWYGNRQYSRHRGPGNC